MCRPHQNIDRPAAAAFAAPGHRKPNFARAAKALDHVTRIRVGRDLGFQLFQILFRSTQPFQALLKQAGPNDFHAFVYIRQKRIFGNTNLRYWRIFYVGFWRKALVFQYRAFTAGGTGRFAGLVVPQRPAFSCHSRASGNAGH